MPLHVLFVYRSSTALHRANLTFPVAIWMPLCIVFKQVRFACARPRTIGASYAGSKLYVVDVNVTRQLVPFAKRLTTALAHFLTT